jgi:cyclase
MSAQRWSTAPPSGLATLPVNVRKVVIEMRLLDLSSPVDASYWEPDPVTHKIMSAAEGARHMASEMHRHFGIEFDVNVLPDGEFLTNDTITLTTHTGTHVDAPSHYGSKAVYGKPRTIDQMPLEWFHNPAFVLDLTDAETGSVGMEDLEKELARIGYDPAPLDIALLNTGASKRIGRPEYFTEFVGLDASAVHFLLNRGIRVIGTDAFSLDAPFAHILRTYQKTGDRGVL